MQGIIPFANKHGSTILTIIGSTGVVVTTLLGIKATPKALEIIKEEENNNQLTLKDKVKLTWKEYIPTIISGVGTVSCIFGANILNKRTQASLTSSYILLKKYFDDYRHENKNIDINNISEGLQNNKCENLDEYINKKVISKKIKKHPPKVKSMGEDDILLYCPLLSTSGTTEKGYVRTKKSIALNLENRINNEINKEGYININKIYSWLGVKDKDLPVWGWQYGWVKTETNRNIMDDVITIKYIQSDFDENGECWFVDVECTPDMGMISFS